MAATLQSFSPLYSHTSLNHPQPFTPPPTPLLNFPIKRKPSQPIRLVSKAFSGKYIRQDYLVKKVSAEELKELVKGERDVPLIVDFYATWCGPCILMAQELEMPSSLEDLWKQGGDITKQRIEALGPKCHNPLSLQSLGHGGYHGTTSSFREQGTKVYTENIWETVICLIQDWDVFCVGAHGVVYSRGRLSIEDKGSVFFGPLGEAS